MMSVAIVGVLAAIAIPSFERYQLKVKTTEARSLLGNIIIAEESFVAEFEQYAAIAPHPQGSPGLTKRAWIEGACPASCSRTNTGDCTSFQCIGFQPASTVYYTYGTMTQVSAAGQTPEYGAGASADLDGDTTQGSYAYRSSNGGQTIGVVGDGVSVCPVDIPVTFIFTCTPINF